MIISFKYKFIFIKTYKTASSSIENYLYPFLDKRDIVAPTEDYNGINCWGDFEINDLYDYFPKHILEKKINAKIKYFAHMPAWLVKERLEELSNKINYDIFKNFFKFGVVRNPYDALVSDYYWRNSSKNKNSKEISFNEIIHELESNKHTMYGPLNLNKLMDKNCENIICDKIIMYEKLDDELDLVFNNLKIPFNSKLNIYKKKSDRNSDYKKFYTKKSQKLVEEIFWKEIEMFGYKF